MEKDNNVTISQHAFEKQQHIRLKKKQIISSNRDHIEQDEDDH